MPDEVSLASSVDSGFVSDLEDDQMSHESFEIGKIQANIITFFIFIKLILECEII